MTKHRLPHAKSCWIWEIDNDQECVLVEVVEARFNGEEWLVQVQRLPETVPSDPRTFTLDRFWEAVTPVGGRVNDLSNGISAGQYKRGD